MRFTQVNALLTALPLASAAVAGYGGPGGYGKGYDGVKGYGGYPHDGVYEHDGYYPDKLKEFLIYYEVSGVTKAASTLVKKYFEEFIFADPVSPIGYEISALITTDAKTDSEVFNLDNYGRLSFVSDAPGSPRIFSFHSIGLQQGEGVALLFTTANLIDDDPYTDYWFWDVKGKSLVLRNPFDPALIPELFVQVCSGDTYPEYYDLFINTVEDTTNCVTVELKIEGVKK